MISFSEPATGPDIDILMYSYLSSARDKTSLVGHSPLARSCIDNFCRWTSHPYWWDGFHSFPLIARCSPRLPPVRLSSPATFCGVLYAARWALAAREDARTHRTGGGDDGVPARESGVPERVQTKCRDLQRRRLQLLFVTDVRHF